MLKEYKRKLELDKNINFTEVPVKTWSDLISVEKTHRSKYDVPNKETEWIFRGTSKAEYPLRTTLERDISNIMGIDANNREHEKKLKDHLKKGLKDVSINKIESGLLRKFKRQCHHYTARIPEENNVIEWLALMRHYGAPSRLLDWTYSFYVAVFFALEHANQECAVWALEKYSLKKNREYKIPDQIWEVLSQDDDVEDCTTWKKVFKRSKPVPFVYPVTPLKLNERIVIQQGDFLCQGDISKTFEENLAAVLPNKKEKKDCGLFKYKINFNAEEYKEALLNLHRMNINRASLFPGLGGFAQSLKTLLLSPKNLIKADDDCKDKKVYKNQM